MNKENNNINNPLFYAFIYACYIVYLPFKILKNLFKPEQIDVDSNELNNLKENLHDITGQKISEPAIIDNTPKQVENDNNNLLTEETVSELNNRLANTRKKKGHHKVSAAKIAQAQTLIEEMKQEGKTERLRDKKLTWKYEAIMTDGKIVKGLFDAYTKSDVINFLSEEDLLVYKIDLLKYSITSNAKVRKIKNKDLIFLITQLSTYLKSGIALADAMGILVKQMKNKNIKKVFRNVKYELMLGESLSSAMSHQKNAFPMILINMVNSAELTGELPEVLDDMAEYFTEIEETRRQMISALTYPTMVLAFTIGVIGFVMIYVVPKFVQIYNSMEDAKIPKFTQIVINVSHFLSDNLIYILLIIIIILSSIIYLYRKVKVARKWMQYVAMKMPVIGNIIIYNEVAIFSKTFASLLKHNVFITESMEILNKISNNEIYHDMILETITNLTRGDKISSAFQDHWAFPIPAYEMIVTGEKTGQLAEMMEKVSSYYQELHRNAVTRVKSLLEPIIIVLLTFGVGIILLAIVVPMFSMYETVQNLEG